MDSHNVKPAYFPVSAGLSAILLVAGDMHEVHNSRVKNDTIGRDYEITQKLYAVRNYIVDEIIVGYENNNFQPFSNDVTEERALVDGVCEVLQREMSFIGFTLDSGELCKELVQSLNKMLDAAAKCQRPAGQIATCDKQAEQVEAICKYVQLINGTQRKPSDSFIVFAYQCPLSTKYRDSYRVKTPTCKDLMRTCGGGVSY